LIGGEHDGCNDTMNRWQFFVGRGILAFWRDGRGIEEGRDLEEGENFRARMLGRLLLEDC